MNALLIVKPKGVAMLPPLVRVAAEIVEPELVGGAPLIIPFEGSSVPGCSCANCPAALYAHNLEARYKQDQRAILALRVGAEAAVKAGAALMRLALVPDPFGSRVEQGRTSLTLLGEGVRMFDTTVLETSPLEERRRIWQRYKTGELSIEAATLQLLRLDIDARVRSRELSNKSKSGQAYLEARYKQDQRAILALRVGAETAVKGGAALVRLALVPDPFGSQVEQGRTSLTLLGEGVRMFDTTVLETPPSEERRRIWQRYKTGELNIEAATLQLLRLDIDARVRSRELSNKSESGQAYLSTG